MSVKFFAALIGLLATLGLVYQDSFKEFLFADSPQDSKQTTTNQSHVEQSLEKVAQVQHPEEVKEILQTNDCSVCQIDGINLSGANLPGATFWSSSLREANFSGSNLAGANFNEADLTGANFKSANLKGANFKKANLSHADLTNASLENASLEDAILFAANLKGANLRGANLKGTQLPSQIINEPSNRETAQTPQSGDVKTIAKEITVRIEAYLSGSGVIIAKEANTYYVLTAAHVMCKNDISVCKDKDDLFDVVTPDGTKKEKLNFNTVKKLPGVDLAVFSFTSTKNYRLARLANSDRISGISGTPVYVSGWPVSDNSSHLFPYVFSGGKIADNSLGSVPDGYSLSYDNATLPGMSGGPVLDADGRVVAIHGQGFNQKIKDKEGNQDLLVKLELNLGIPINAFLQLASKSGINLRLQVDSTQPPESARRSARVPIASEAIQNPNTRTAKAVIWANKGFDLLVGKQLQQALTTFEQAIQIQPDLHSAWYGKGRTLEALNRNQEALVALDKTIQLQRNFYYALQARGDLLRDLNRGQEAIASYNQIINDKPQNNLYLHRLFQPHAYVMRGATRYDIGDREGAIADYGQAIAINQDFARAYYFRASVYLEMRNKQLAIKDFKAAAERYLAQGNVEGYQKTRQLLSFIDR
ncbi:pentapeptide repeat-containing protein [Microcoleus sp. F6_B4]